MQEITNLGYAAYLMLKGYKLLEPPSRKDGKFIFKFTIETDINHKMFYEYTTGEFSKFDGMIVNLKKTLPRY